MSMRLLARCSLCLSALTACVLAAVAQPARARADTPTSQIGKKVEPFALKDTTGKVWSLADLGDKKAVVVVFVGTQCPINNLFMGRLAELQRDYADKEVQFLAVNANRQ